MVAIVVLALTGRFVGFAQTALESGVPLTTERAFSYFMDLLFVFTQVGNAGLLVSVLGAASLIRICITSPIVLSCSVCEKERALIRKT
jgi:hypothetical protein